MALEASSPVDPMTDPDAERIVLAGCILDPYVLATARSRMSSRHFSAEPHRDLWVILSDLFDHQQQVDIGTVADAVKKRKGKGELAKLAKWASEYAYSPEVTISRLSRLEDLALRRDVAEAATRLAAAARDSQKPAVDLLRDATDALYAVGRPCEQDDTASGEGIANALLSDWDSPRQGVNTGMADLDRLLQGLTRGTISVLAGRPGMGKTQTAVQIAHNVAMAGNGVLYVSLEMTRVELGKRLLALYSGIPLQALRHWRIPDPLQGQPDVHGRAAKGIEQISRLPLFVDDRGGQIVPQIRAAARRIQAKGPLDLVVVDYLGLLADGIDVRSPESVRIGRISAALLEMAKNLDVAVLVLSQLNRSVESRGEKRPNLADIRDSGAIEQDAYAVMFVYREGYYKPEADQTDLEIIVGKHRGGPTGAVKMHYQPQTGRISNRER